MTKKKSKQNIKFLKACDNLKVLSVNQYWKVIRYTLNNLFLFVQSIRLDIFCYFSKAKIASKQLVYWFYHLCSINNSLAYFYKTNLRYIFKLKSLKLSCACAAQENKKEYFILSNVIFILRFVISLYDLLLFCSLKYW